MEFVVFVLSKAQFPAAQITLKLYFCTSKKILHLFHSVQVLANYKAIATCFDGIN